MYLIMSSLPVTYFAAWTNVHKPKARKNDLEQYLAFLTDDSRASDGKAMMCKGIHPDSGKKVVIDNTVFEALEIENISDTSLQWLIRD